MSDDPTALPPAVLACLNAAFGFLEADRIYGPNDPLTIAAKTRLREAFAALMVEDDDPLILTIIEGGLEDEDE